MRKDLIKDLFGISDTVFEKVVENVKEALNNLECDVPECDDDNLSESYFSSSKKEYNNGKLVKKSEKEYINGECTKDEEFDITKSLGCDKEEPCKDGECKRHNKMRHRLFEENKELKRQINEMTQYIDTLNDTIKDLTNENKRLEEMVNNVKKCFSI